MIFVCVCVCVCVCEAAWYVFLLCASELHLTIENWLISCTVGLADMFFHYHEHTHTHTVVYFDSPLQKPHFLLFKEIIWPDVKVKLNIMCCFKDLGPQWEPTGSETTRYVFWCFLGFVNNKKSTEECCQLMKLWGQKLDWGIHNPSVKHSSFTFDLCVSHLKGKIRHTGGVRCTNWCYWETSLHPRNIKSELKLE